MDRINRCLDNRISMILMLRVDMARIIIDTIERDSDNKLPFYTERLRRDMLDTTHQRLQETLEEARVLALSLPLDMPINAKVRSMLKGVPGDLETIPRNLIKSPYYVVDVLCRLSTMLDLDCVRFMYAINFFTPGWREAIAQEIRYRQSVNPSNA